jgi:photosystem II stability/assembly factor-like uncharacterized protein
MMQLGPLVAVGADTVYLTGAHANSGPQWHWIVLTNESGHWRAATIPITPAMPDFSRPPATLSFATDATGFLAGQSASGQGAMLGTTDGGRRWIAATPHIAAHDRPR